MNRYFGVHVLDGEWHALLPRYLLLAHRIEDKRILDIGCGTGIGSSLLLELGAERVDGVDYRPGVLDLANIKHAKESLDFHTMLWEELDFPDASFDLVTCLDPQTPVTDPNLLEEVSRVLTDDGEYVCAIERRTIEGFESLLPKYGYTAPAENVELGHGDEQAPQIGQLTKYFDKQISVLQRPEYNYVFESEDADAQDDDASGPIDYTLCTEDSHIAGVELLFCGPESMNEPANRTVRLPYYRLAERLGTVIRDLNLRQGPGNDQTPFEGPVEAGLGDQTSPHTAPDDEWSDEQETGVHERPDRETQKQPGHDDSVDDEIERLTAGYRQLHRNVQQLRQETQSAMVAQERSIDQLVQLLNQWRHEDLSAQQPAPEDGGKISQSAPTGIFEAAGAEDSPPEAGTADERNSERDSLEQKLDQLLEERERQQAYIDELERKLADLEADVGEAPGETSPAEDESAEDGAGGDEDDPPTDAEETDTDSND